MGYDDDGRTMAADDDDNNVNGNGATGNEVDDDGNGAMGDEISQRWRRR